MAHRLRQDRPGSWHHVFARGMARRTVFEHVRDIRVFKRLLALEGILSQAQSREVSQRLL